MLPEIIIDTPANLAERFAARLADEGRRALALRGRFAVALPGGSVARAFFPRLARDSFDWSQTDFFWVDERAVPVDDPASNYGLARALWLNPAAVPADRVHRLEADAADLEGAALRAEHDLVRCLGRPPRLDIALLGVGADGHVCSLFPGHALLDEERRWIGVETAAPMLPLRRLTLTLPALTAAELIVVATFGTAKADAVRRALRDQNSTLPVARVLHRARRALVLLDPEASR
ncbi:MAG TPA: 6-phosphogluconolactonase [Vicinamibacterales bacterium]|nr:6-phosphogluconolactonase [Vicinamibacterales bacterium]